MNKQSNVPYVLLVGIENQIQDFMSKSEIIDLTKAFAKGVNKKVPITEVGYETKKEILAKNIGCLSEDEKFEFMSQLQKLSFIKCRPELDEEITDFLSYRVQINSSKSRNSISDLLVIYPPKIRRQWVKACAFFDKKDYRNSLDNMRLTVELLVKNLTKSDASLENQKENLGKFLQAKGINKQVSNFLFKILNIYEKIQNDQAKHDVPDHLKHEEVTFIMNQSYVIIKFLVDCDKSSF